MAGGGGGSGGYDNPHASASDAYGYSDSASSYASYGNEQYPQQQQQQYSDQQQYYGGDPSQQHESQYYDDGYSNNMDPSQHQAYYGEPNLQQQQQIYQDPSQQQHEQTYYGDMGAETDWNMMAVGGGEAMMMDPSQQSHAAMMIRQQHVQQLTAEKGSYYQESEYSPELLYGRAVSALAFDPMYECMYLAGTTQSLSTTRFNAHRASLLMTYTTPNLSQQGLGGESIMYSSVAGHPEASSLTLQAVYQSLYGISKVVVTPHISSAGSRGKNHPPSHAYLPPYGGGGLSDSAAVPHMMYSGGMQQPQSQQSGHIGITDLLPLGNGYATSVSPSAVRIHSYGGLQLNDHVIDGMLCGTIHPHSGPGGATHVTVGGLSTSAIAKSSPTSDNDDPSTSEYTSKRHHQQDNSNIHCLDLWQGLRPIYSRAFKDQASSEEAIAVTALSVSHERGSVVAGCSDGNIRILDGSLRELATVKSHAGGVSSISVSPDGLLIATTGFSSKARPASSGGTSGALYSFPDPKAYIYDIRYLGRGGISHPFSGVKGAPRFARFMPDVDGCASNRLLLASGKSGGGIQILTPFEPQEGNTANFLIPQLQQGESMTAFSTPVDDGDELAVGTSLGRVLRYRLSGFGKNASKTKMKHDSVTSSWSKNPQSSPIAETSGASYIESTSPKLVLDIPPFGPPPPDLSLDPTLLQGDPNMRNGTSEEIRSIFGTYTLLVRCRRNVSSAVREDIVLIILLV